ncbi:hypothetical protein P3X46_022720 [Hevea brasiliensis]|uniref:GH18 domain-containing protein n=1 Tax=Hevea brasiliensis TaxID=3981 RepID=A0ABQ9L9S6_HEVBR|nr:class V chitinase CHIT5a [Hevea brasiliensis]KAJ9162997.1 hypothetical protein P3X46_022720 [Hevea brasiliensis]
MARCRVLVPLLWSMIFIVHAFPTFLASTYSYNTLDDESNSDYIWSPPLATGPAPAPTPLSGAIKGGYWPSWKAEALPPSTIPTCFSHLFYAFLGLDTSSYQLGVTQHDDQWMKSFTNTLHAKQLPAKTFLSIGGGNSNASTFSTMASNATSRAAFINSSIEVARKYNFDGLDLGWEFPNTKEDMSSLSLLFEEWYNAIEYESLSGQPRLLLAAGVYFAPSFFLSDVYREYPTDAISKYVDFLNVMCFDYHGKWNTSVTAEHALLYDKSTNISTSYGISSWIEAGVPAEKLVMGLPLYGRTWQLLDPEVHGIGAPAVGVGPGEDGFMPYIDIIDFNSANAAPEVYDEETVSTYSYSGTNWIGYDGVKSIREKVKFANDQGLAGYFIWSLGYDNNWNLSTEASRAWDSNNN